MRTKRVAAQNTSTQLLLRRRNIQNSKSLSSITFPRLPVFHAKTILAISQPLNFPRHFIPENPPFASSVPAVSLKSSVTSCRLLLSVRQFFNFENLKLGFQFWEFLEDQTSDICSAADRSVRKRIPRLPVDFLVLVYIGILSFLPTISTGDESHLVFPHLFSASLPLRNCLPTVERDHVYCSFSSLQTDSSSSPS